MSTLLSIQAAASPAATSAIASTSRCGAHVQAVNTCDRRQSAAARPGSASRAPTMSCRRRVAQRVRRTGASLGAVTAACPAIEMCADAQTPRFAASIVNTGRWRGLRSS